MKPTLLTTLSLSWGRQSTWILWEMILGLRPVPENFVALAADPGMEKGKTYEYRDYMLGIAREAGIEVRLCEGDNLFRDLTEKVPAIIARARACFSGNDEQWEAFLSSIHTYRKGDRANHLRANIGFVPRLALPAYFVRQEKVDKRTGELRVVSGKMPQKCTENYKIVPMRREIRRILEEKYGIHPRSGRLPGKIKTWIGFATDEVHRVKPSDVGYIDLAYPLIEDGLSRPDVDERYVKHGVPIPPSSVCNGCFSHGLGSYADMHKKSPGDFAAAVKVDESVRDLRIFGIANPVYVSRTLLPIRQLEAMNFDLGDPWVNDAHTCNSGVCFL